jgi:hypothetical protein
MSTEHRDYIMRIIEEFGFVLRRLVGRLQLGRDAAAEVIQEAQTAQATLLGSRAASAPFVDAATAVRLMQNPERVALWVEFLRVEAAAQRLEGREPQAVALEDRARALEQAAAEAASPDG